MQTRRTRPVASVIITIIRARVFRERCSETRRARHGERDKRVKRRDTQTGRYETTAVRVIDRLGTSKLPVKNETRARVAGRTVRNRRSARIANAFCGSLHGFTGAHRAAASRIAATARARFFGVKSGYDNSELVIKKKKGAFHRLRCRTPSRWQFLFPDIEFRAITSQRLVTTAAVIRLRRGYLKK